MGFSSHLPVELITKVNRASKKRWRPRSRRACVRELRDKEGQGESGQSESELLER